MDGSISLEDMPAIDRIQPETIDLPGASICEMDSDLGFGRCLKDYRNLADRVGDGTRRQFNSPLLSFNAPIDKRCSRIKEFISIQQQEIK